MRASRLETDRSGRHLGTCALAAIAVGASRAQAYYGGEFADDEVLRVREFAHRCTINAIGMETDEMTMREQHTAADGLSERKVSSRNGPLLRSSQLLGVSPFLEGVDSRRPLCIYTSRQTSTI